MRNKRNLKVTEVNSKANVYMLVIVLSCIALYSISPYALILTGFGLLPGFIAIIIDQDKERYISHIVMSLNLAGLVPYLYKVFKYKSSATTIETIIDPKTWLVIFSSAAIGWIIYWLVPQVANMCYSVIIKAKISNLRKELDELSEEWGEDIKTQ